MEKVKEFTDFAKRHHFWFIAAIVTVAALFVGWMANSALDQKFTTDSSALGTAKTNIKTVEDKTRNKHPNTKFEEEMIKINKERQQNVEKAWTNMYQQQRDSILKWPEDLTKDFRDEVRNNTLRGDPIERIDLTADPKRDIPSHLRVEYKNYIEEELPKLAAEIGAEWNPAGNMGPMPPNDPNAPVKKEPIVLWHGADQALVLRHFTWPGEAPTTHQLLYAQEDLWVLTALIQIIKRTNGAAETRHKAAIREILAIEMGKDVKGRAGQVQRLMAAVDPANPMAPMPLAPMAPMPLANPADPLAAAKALNDPASDRYVNLNYEPLTGEALKTAVNSALAADAYAAVAKRMPIRLRVKMDTRKLNKLLAECGNSTLPVEIRQVRIGCAPGVGMAAPGPGGPGPGVFGPRPGPGHEGGPRPPAPPIMGPRPGNEGANGNLDEFPHDKEVELYGIIYIFNPVNQLYSAEELAAMKAAEQANPMAPMAGAVATPPAGGVAPLPPAPAPMPMP